MEKDFVEIVWMFLFVSVYCQGSSTMVFIDFSTTSYSLFKFSIIPLLIPNTPYSDSPKASYVEQAMTGMLLGAGGLVKKYEGGGTYFKYAQGEVHLDYLNHVSLSFLYLKI